MEYVDRCGTGKVFLVEVNGSISTRFLKQGTNGE